MATDKNKEKANTKPVLSDIELAVRYSQALEALLAKSFGATGTGLFVLTKSVENRLPPATVNRLRQVAWLRNKVVHEEGFALPNRDAFMLSCRQCESELKDAHEKELARAAARQAARAKASEKALDGRRGRIIRRRALVLSLILTPFIYAIGLLVELNLVGLAYQAATTSSELLLAAIPPGVLTFVFIRFMRRALRPPRSHAPAAGATAASASGQVSSSSSRSAPPSTVGRDSKPRVLDDSCVLKMSSGVEPVEFNPGSGLPMVAGSGVDTGGYALGFGPRDETASDEIRPVVNPMTGLFMDPSGQFDSAGNPYGFNFTEDTSPACSSLTKPAGAASFDDGSLTGGAVFADDAFGSSFSSSSFDDSSSSSSFNDPFAS